MRARALLGTAGLLAFGLTLGPAVSAALSPPPMTEPERLERDLVAAIGKLDLATYDRIVADDYAVADAAGKTITKAEVMASYRDGSRKYTNLEIFDVQSRVYGDTAVVTARTKGMRREDGKDVVNDVRYMRVYARRGGRWQAVAQMSTPAK
jgi:ketosteroid isomerase-like protein